MHSVATFEIGHRRCALWPLLLCAVLGLNGGCVGWGSTDSATLPAHQRFVRDAVAGDGPGIRSLALSAVVDDVRALPLSRSGNRSVYTVAGRQYRVRPQANGFIQVGQASWYGKKFHGRPTASGELYDMHALTAAHKSLPLPSFVLVENLGNGQRVVVKVNDRGPFADGRIIDLSYAAAVHLGFDDKGVAPVRMQLLAGPQTAAATTSMPASPLKIPTASAPIIVAGPQQYLQVGAFRKPEMAMRLLAKATGELALDGRISQHPASDMYRVQIGPLADASALDAALQDLPRIGIKSWLIIQSH